jgi:hypothetical protein
MADVNELRILHRFHIVRLVRTSGLQKPASLVGIALAPLSVSLSLGKGLNFSVPQFQRELVSTSRGLMRIALNGS